MRFFLRLRTLDLLRVTVSLLSLTICAMGADAPRPRILRLPHLEANLDTHQLRVECDALDTSAPLEFFCCKTGTNEYESLLRSEVKPSDLHTALLALGLKPGSPVTYSESLKKLIPPHGPPLRINVEYEKDGKTISAPALHWLRDQKSKQEPNGFGWIFAGSRVMNDGKYAADTTGYLVSVVNFDLTVIDVSILASSANETLEWERNPDIAPKGGTKVWMVIEALGNQAPSATDPKSVRPAESKSGTDNRGPSSDASVAATAIAASPASITAPTDPTTHPSLSDVHLDQAKVDRLQQYWEGKVLPHAKALRESAEAHYQVITDLRTEQQRLIDEADRIQRTIDKLEKQYQDMTTPHPQAESQ